MNKEIITLLYIILYLYMIQSFIKNDYKQYRHINNNKIIMNMNNNNQWNLMKQYHVGRWFGYTTIHDIDDDDDDEQNSILSSRLTGTSLKLNNDGTIVNHINSLHKEYLCMKDMNMNIKSLKLNEIIDFPLAMYDSQNITSKFCYNIALSGPNQLKNNDILIQLSIRHHIYRYRILLHYEQIGSITLKGTSIKVPSSGGNINIKTQYQLMTYNIIID